MPELPEVEVIRRWLVRDLALVGAPLDELSGERELTAPGQRHLTENLVSIERRGKALDWVFESGALELHLRMTGDLVVGTHPRARAVFRFGARALSLIDARRLATLRAAPKEHTLGPDALRAPPSGDELRRAIGASQRSLKAALLDQSIVAGLGNIWVDEVCFVAGVRPAHPASDVDLDAVAAAIPEVISAATAALDVARSASGHGIDWVRHKRDALDTRVHGRERCARCASVVSTARVAGRGTYWCARCQAY